MTVLAQKMKEAGIDTDAISLDSACRDAMDAAKGNIDRAVERLAHIVRSRPDLLRIVIRRALIEFQNSAQADGGPSDRAQAGQSTIAADSSRGEGQISAATGGQITTAPATGPEFADGEGHFFPDAKSSVGVPPVREPSLTEAARVLRKAPGSGAGALKPAAYAFRDQIRGESWLLTYKDPTGTRMIARTFGENHAIAQRLIREGGERLTAGAIAAALALEGEKLGRVSPDQVIEKTLSPAALDRVARLLAPDKIYATARKVARDFTQSHAALMENANG